MHIPKGNTAELTLVTTNEFAPISEKRITLYTVIAD